MENREMVYTTSVEHLAHMMRDKLEAEGVNALILNQKDSTLVWGSLELYVLKDDFEKAKAIVGENQE
jgi:hypothetical protein